MFRFVTQYKDLYYHYYLFEILFHVLSRFTLSGLFLVPIILDQEGLPIGKVLRDDSRRKTPE